MVERVGVGREAGDAGDAGREGKKRGIVSSVGRRSASLPKNQMPDDLESLAARAAAAEARLAALETADASAARVAGSQAEESERLRYQVRALQRSLAEADADVLAALNGDEAARAAVRAKVEARGGG